MTLRPADEAAREWLNSREGMDGSFSSDDLNFVERIWQASRQEAVEAAAGEAQAWLDEFAGTSVKHVSAQQWANSAVKDVRDCIRQLASPAGKMEG